MRGAFAALAVLFLMPAAAQAQTGKHVAIGGSVGVNNYTNDRFDQGVALSLLYRLSADGTESNGWSWGPSVSAGFTRANVRSDFGVNDMTLGKLQTIPLMAGFGPHYRHGRIWSGFSVTAGASFNHFDLDEPAREDYAARFGNSLESVTTTNSFALRPGVSVWYDVSSRLGLYGGAAYFYSRPKATITAGGVTTTENWTMDYVGFSVGAVVGAF